MPNRIIKESICSSETIDSLSWFEEIIFYRLLVNCDDYGRMDARTAILKAKLFPLKERLALKDIQSALQKLADIGCVRMYVCDNKPYLYLPTWEVHQNIRAKKSKYPEPPKASIDGLHTHESICKQMYSDDSICSRNPIQSESESEYESNPNVVVVNAREKVQRVISAYVNRINPTPSDQSLGLLRGYTEDLGAEVVLRAIDIALDERKTSWSYIQGILKNWKSKGVRCIADIERLDVKRNTKREDKPSSDLEQKKKWLDDYIAREEMQNANAGRNSEVFSLDVGVLPEHQD